MGKRLDLKDKIFGELKVIEYVGNRMWMCKCSCGRTKQICGSSLTSGATKTCGHRTTGFKDLTNQVFGELTVKEYLGKSYWLCECSCGNITRVHRSNLKSGDVKSCGHINNNRKIALDDLKGQVFGKLTVMGYAGNRFYNCRCECGNIVKAGRYSLENKLRVSCGCKQHKAISAEEITTAINQYINKYGEKPYADELSEFLSIKRDQIHRYIDRYNLHNKLNTTYGSRYEKDICSFLREYKLHDRRILNGQELDIYLDKNLDKNRTAIEFNGNYWHSDLVKDKYYHQQKTLNCAKNSIRLIHIFEYEWENNKDKIIRLLESLDKQDTKVIGARKTSVKIISNKEAIEFQNTYHLQGGINSSVNIGCFYNNELIGVMSFNKPRFNSNYEYEVTRLCWNYNYKVAGGLEKMFSLFIKEYKPISILTYVDISKFTGNSYTRLGFKPTKEEAITEPNYVWVKEGTNNYLTRYQTQKHKLVSEGLGTSEQTEDEIMRQLGYFRIYDSGNLKMEWISA